MYTWLIQIGFPNLLCETDNSKNITYYQMFYEWSELKIWIVSHF